MSVRQLVSIVLLTLMSLSACGPARTFPPPAPTPDRDWTMTLSQTGGFAGVHYVIRVTSAGGVQAEDQRTGRSATLRLSLGEVAELDGLRQSLPSQQTRRLPSACADCFIYELEIVSKTEVLRVLADDTTLSDSGSGALINYLLELRDRALSSVS